MQPRAVLFIGNSFTQRHDVPAMVAALAAAASHPVEHWLVSAGGASLRRHWNAGEASDLIKSGAYDTVVLQEQSTLPIKNAARMRESVLHFHGLITASKARTVLYMTWARAHAAESQKAITDAYTSLADELGAILAPAGLAWQHLLTQPGHPVLHDKDGSHPTLAGSYLAACALFAAIFGLRTTGSSAFPAALDEATARLLQKAADAVMKH